jgi:nicotinate phosphoribosyltransferase
MAHEIFSAVAAMAGVENANNVVLGKWANTYHGLLGVALPDTFTTEFFLRTYNPFYANLYYGLRHDSHQEPNVWTDMVLNHLQKLGVDTRAKRLVYSDGIDSFDRVDAILNHRQDECMKSFGIGTWLTNDLQHINGAEALNVVMKLIAAQKNAYEPMYHACKLSDVDGKETGDLVTIKEYKRKIDNAHPVPPIDEIIPQKRAED